MKIKDYAELWQAAVDAAIDWIRRGDALTPQERGKFYAQIEELAKWTQEYQGHVRTRVMMDAVDSLNRRSNQ